MLAIKNTYANVAEYVVNEIATNNELKESAYKLYKLNQKKKPKSIIKVIEMLTEMYSDFCWTCGFGEDEIAMMSVDLKQFIVESIEILEF